MKAGLMTHDESLSQPYNLARHYDEVARDNADFPAIIGPDMVLTHGDFRQIVHRIAGRLAAAGVGPGSIVALNAAQMVETLGVLLATAHLGAGFIMANPVLAKTRKVIPTHFFRTPQMSGHPAVPFQLIGPDWFSADGPGFAPQPSDPDAPWLYLHTSGSTGTPKFIGLSQQMVRLRSRAAQVDFPFRATTLATYFDAGSRPFFARGLAALLQACTIVDSTDPLFWRECGVNLVAASPIQIIQAFGDTPLSPRIARAEVSGARIPDAEAIRLLDSFDMVLDVYGASETSKSFANQILRDPAGALVQHGRPQDSQVQIVDDAGNLVGPGMVGAVRVKNPYMAAGYIDDPSATAESFREGWFYPGDLASWSDQGALRIVGRSDDVINLGGYKIYGNLLDGLIMSVPGVTSAISLRNPIAGASHMVLAFIVYDDPSNAYQINELVIQTCWQRLGFQLSMQALRPIDAIPMDSKGSPDRRACAALVLAKAAEWGHLDR